MARSDSTLLAALAADAIPLADPLGRLDDRDARMLADQIAEGARVVCLGEASHGTYDFYLLRAAITRQLIEHHGFRGVCIEGDWPDARCVDRYVRGTSRDPDADAALGGFRRFPRWMWRNPVVLSFVEWLRGWNAARDASAQAGFYGIDLYSLHGSIEAVLRYLEQVDPPAAERARARYACFGHAGEDPQAYGYVASYDLTQSCEDEVVRQLVELQRCASEYAGTGPGAQEDFFSAERNAQLVANAEQYYRSMFRGRVSSWNLRDTHMADTLDAVIEHLGREGGEAKVVVWAHNSHLGDARATEMGRGGELNVGQLVRERWGGGARLVGFTTHTGTVTAAHDWDEPASRKAVRPSLAHSYERLLHDTGLPAFALDLRRTTEATEGLRVERLERAIGVIYRPETERMSHYFHAELPRQFDFVIHLDVTRALPPLEPGDRWHAGAEEPPETYPSAL